MWVPARCHLWGCHFYPLGSRPDSHTGCFMHQFRPATCLSSIIKYSGWHIDSLFHPLSKVNAPWALHIRLSQTPATFWTEEAHRHLPHRGAQQVLPIHLPGFGWGNYKPKPKPAHVPRSLNPSGCIYAPAEMRPALGHRNAFSAGERSRISVLFLMFLECSLYGGKSLFSFP